ncbi:MAG: family 10 glycosylhydrolase [Bacteroidia bacterium]
MDLKASSGWLLFMAFACLICLAPRESRHPAAPKREFRGVWITTFANLDWPSRKGLAPLIQQAEFEKLLDRLCAIGFNAVLVQIRPSGDAFYPSAYEPWSEFLSGKQGVDPGYDPLAFMIEAAHERNLEFHAWVNPFRGVSHTRFSSLSPGHFSNRYPHWFFTHGNSRYLNPGIPEVRDYLSCVILEIAERYEIDGVHFDDYFYPYPDEQIFIGDLDTYAHYGSSDSDLASWRRANINTFIKQVSDSLHKHSPRVKFGISPPAVWRNKREDPEGSETQADLAAYDHLFADSRKWLRQGWIDYLSPQCYHHHRYNKARFPSLATWWSENAAGRHVYLGHAAYKVKEGKWAAWRRKKEIPDQVELGRKLDGINGSIFYRAKSFEGNPFQIEDQLKDQLFKVPALPPTMPWKDNTPPMAPVSPVLTSSDLFWEPGAPASDHEKAWKYVVYFFPDKTTVNLNDPASIHTITQKTSTPIPSNQVGTWAITGLDRLGNESEALLVESPANRLVSAAK